jgi:hypothetical protein
MMAGRPDRETGINGGAVVAGKAHVAAAGLAIENRLHATLLRIGFVEGLHPSDMTNGALPA